MLRVEKDSNPVDARLERAGNYEKLRSFSRVGGVLIGRAPSSEKTIDLTGIDWTISGGAVALSVRTAGGNTVRLGSFARGLVNQALAFATDPRPVALTM